MLLFVGSLFDTQIWAETAEFQSRLS